MGESGPLGCHSCSCRHTYPRPPCHPGLSVRVFWPATVWRDEGGPCWGRNTTPRHPTGGLPTATAVCLLWKPGDEDCTTQGDNMWALLWYLCLHAIKLLLKNLPKALMIFMIPHFFVALSYTITAVYEHGPILQVGVWCSNGSPVVFYLVPSH